MWDTIVITPFINALLFIYKVVGSNFGIAIILFTILIRLVTHPLMVKQIKGAQGMQEMQQDPEWLKIQEKYKGDKEKLAQEQMAYYKEKGISPFASCLPTLIQFPIIIALYQSVIAALVSTPVETLNLARHVYPQFLDVANLLPLNSTFLWMDLGAPERLKSLLFAVWDSGISDCGCHIYVCAIQIDPDPQRKSKRSNRYDE